MLGNVPRILEEVTRQNTLLLMRKSIYERDLNAIKGSLKQNRYQESNLVRRTGVEPANVCTTGP